jgi:hypothetical protein
MNVEIQSNDDENFKIVTKQFGGAYLVTDGERVAIESTPESTPEEAEESLEQMQTIGRTKIPAPLENPKGLGWFDGTSWGNK